MPNLEKAAAPPAGREAVGRNGCDLRCNGAPTELTKFGPDPTTPHSACPEGTGQGQYFRLRVGHQLPPAERDHPGEAVIVTTRTRGSGLLTRRNTIVATAMGLISFALGFFTHPM